MALSVNKPQIPDFEKVVGAFLKDIQGKLEETTNNFMEDQLKEFRDRIRRQDFPSFHAEPLSPRYRAKKKRLGLPLSTMVATGTYLEALQLVKKAKRGGITAYIIQIDPTVKARDLEGNVREDITIAEVAFINEHGSQRLQNRPPARPHWAPFVVAFGMSAEKRRKYIANLVKAAWNKTVLGKNTKTVRAP